MRNMYEHPAYVPRGIMKIIPFWEYRYPETFIRIGWVASLSLIILGVVLCAVGYWWGAVLFAPAALRLWIAYQLVQFVHS